MKRKTILKRLDRAIPEHRCLNGYMKYDPVYFSFIPLRRSETLVLAAKEQDFLLDGYQIFPVDGIRRVGGTGKGGGHYDRMMCAEHVLDHLDIPDVPLTGWREIFTCFHALHEPVEMDTKYGFYIGRIAEVKKKSVFLHYFDARGKWYGPVKLRYEDIFLLAFRNRYLNVTTKYTEEDHAAE